MPLLVESLKASDGRFEDLAPHEERMAHSRRALFGRTDPVSLAAALDRVRNALGEGLWKVRVLYGESIQRVEAAVYRPRPYRSAALVDGGTVSYDHKTADRPDLDALTRRAEDAGADTALITLGGLMTDFSYANAAFFDGRDWWTPERPLLAGTRRARLLAAGRLRTAEIGVGDVHRFQRVSPINAMMDLDEVSLPVDRIIPISDTEVRPL